MAISYSRPGKEQTALLSVGSALVVLVIVVPRLAGLYAMNVFDDAFITFQHSENLATGDGMVFNRGERVLGTTAPLFAIFLAALGWIGWPIPEVALATGIAADAVSGVLIYRVLGRYLGTLPAIASTTFLRWIHTSFA